MSRTLTVRTYGRKTASCRTKPGLSFSEMPTSPTDRTRSRHRTRDVVDDLAEKLTLVSLDSTHKPTKPARPRWGGEEDNAAGEPTEEEGKEGKEGNEPEDGQEEDDVEEDALQPLPDTSDFLDSSYCDDSSIDAGLRVLTWADLCPPDCPPGMETARMEKIAEASYAEVYRVTNERGTSIIKAIRLASPIRAQTKAQVRSGLVDEEPHDEADLRGELAISELLADIPGFVVYKERYIVRGRTTKQLLETHQAFQRRAKRQDPDRLQFYPSPSRYLDDTQFLVIELGDAGQALEDTPIESAWQLWDVFLHVAIALARAEDQVRFEHRDLHEGNLCVRQVGAPREKAASGPGADTPVVFGYSGLDITILDYGLSRADEAGDVDDGYGSSSTSSKNSTSSTSREPIAFDLEKDLSLFTSTHAAQCKVYRQMRSYLLKGDRVHLPPRCHQTPYDSDADGRPITWKVFRPYTNVLWLAYLYGYLVRSFCGDKQDLTRFRRMTRELWLHLNPEAPPAILSFGSATDIVHFAVESGWLTEDQLMDAGGEEGERSWLAEQAGEAMRPAGSRESIIGETGGGLALRPKEAEELSEPRPGQQEADEADELMPRRSPRRRRPVVRYGENL